MVCPKCGKNVADGAKFCGYCGTKLEGFSEENFSAVQISESSAPMARKYAMVEQTVVKPRKKVNKFAIAGVLLAVLAVLIVIFGVSRLFKDKNAYVCLKDGRYALITDLNKEKIVELTSNRAEEMELIFSPDGKYLYYFSRLNDYENAGTLCRAEYGKLKANSSNNSRYIVTIDTDVSVNMNWTTNEQVPVLFLDGETILYMDDDNGLYVFDGETSQQIARDVIYVKTDSKNRLIYGVTSSESSGMNLYTTDPSNPTKRTRLGENVYSIISDSNFDQITYVSKMRNWEEQDLYLTGIGKEPELVEQNVNFQVSYHYSEDGEKYTTYLEGDTEQKNVFTGNLIDFSETGTEVSTLKILEDGKPVVLAENVMNYSQGYNNIIAYMVWENDEPIDFDALINSVSDFNDLSNLEDLIWDSVGIYLYQPEEKRTIHYTGDFLQLCKEEMDDIVNMFVLEDQVFLESEGVLYVADIVDDAVSSYSILSDNGRIYVAADGKMYYLDRIYEENGKVYGELFLYKKNDSQQLLSDVLTSSITVYEDGTVTGLTDLYYSGETLIGDLVFASPKKEQTVIGYDVQDALYVENGNWLYISNDDLYRFDGKESKRITTGVSAITSYTKVEDLTDEATYF